MSGIGCPTREELTSYALGEIVEADADAISRHLESCTACEATLVELESATDRLIDLCRQPAPLDRYSQEVSCHDAITRAIALGGGFADATEATPAETVAAPTEEDEEPVLGQMGDYKLVEELSHGGMGTVYRAIHVRLRREVALKVLPKGRNTDHRAVARFEREMAAVGKLDHPHIVRATDAGEVEGVQYLAMELIDGFDLTELVDYLGPLGVANSCEIIRQAALGLQCAYEQGLVHRDIKPSNVMVTSSGIAKILDLGLARFHIDKQSNVELTTAGQPMGTADYMAPEQVADTHSVDIRADVYSLGCTFYKILAGQPPFGGVQYSSSFDKMMAHRKESPPPIQEFRPDLPKKVVAILEQMLAKDPDDRFQKPSDLAESLYPLCAGANLPDMIEKAWQAAETAPMPQSAPEATPSGDRQEGSSATTPRRKRRGPNLGSTGGSSTHSASRSQYSNFYVMPPPPKQQWGLWLTIFVLSSLLVGILGAYGITAYLNRTQTTVPDLIVAGTRNSWGLPKRPAVEIPNVEALTLPAPTRPLVAVRGALGQDALVSDPPKLEGVKSWTLETIAHRAPILSAAVSSDEKTLATGGGEGAIRIWDLADGDLSSILIHPGRGGAVRALAWAPESSYLAAAYTSGELLIWDVNAGTLVGEVFKTRSTEPDSLVWSPDGTILAFIGENPDQPEHDAVLLWNARNNRTLPALTGAEGPLQVVAFAPDGSKLAAGGDDLNIHIWDLSSGMELLQISTSHIESISALAWSPCGTMIASSCSGGLSPQGVSVWDLEDGGNLGDLPPHPGGDRCLLWLAKEPILIASGGGRDGRTRYYDLQRGAVGQESDTGRSLLCRVGSTDRVIVVEENGQVRVCDAAGFGAVIANLPMYSSVPTALAAAPDGKSVACGSDDGFIRFVDTASGELKRQPLVMKGAVRRLVYSPGANAVEAMLAVTTEDWNQNYQRMEATTSVLNAQSGDTIWDFELSSTERIDDLAWSPDGAWIATAGEALKIWNGKTGEFDREYLHEADSVVWASGGTSVALGSPSGVVLLDSSGGNDIYSLQEASGFPRVMAWSETAGLLATTSGTRENPQIVLLQGKSGATEPRRLAGSHGEPIAALGWRADGKSLLSGSRSETCIWDVEKETATRRAIGAELFTPDGSSSVLSGPGTIRFQRTEDGAALRTVLWLSDIKYAVISPDGNYTGSSQLGDLLTYVVQSEERQTILDARQFAERFGWKNAPEKVTNRQE